MVSAIFVGQEGNGGAAVKAGNHASQKQGGGAAAAAAAGAGGGGVSDAAVEAAKAGYQDESGLSDGAGKLTDNGNMMQVLGDDVDTGGATANSTMVSEFRSGKLNDNPAMVVETAPNSGQYRAIDSKSAEILASARAAGGRANTVIVKNQPGHIKAAQELQRIQAQNISFRQPYVKRRAYELSDVGNYMSVGGASLSGGSRSGYSSRDVNRAAKSVLDGNTRPWAPVRVRQTGGDNFQVVGSRFSLDVAQRAGVRPWFVVVE